MTDNLVERIDARAHQGIAATPFNLLMDAKERIEALTAERDARIDPTQVQAMINAAEPMLAEALAAAEAECGRYRVALEKIAKCTQVSPSGEDRPSYEAQIALDALGPPPHAIEAARAALKGETP